MNKPYSSEIGPSSYDPCEDEIGLMNLLRVLWKWKYLILIGTFVCALGAAIVSLNMTKIWGITTVLQPGRLGATGDGSIVYIDSALNIKDTIEGGGLNDQALKNVSFPNDVNKPISVRFKVTLLKGSNILEVVYETPYKDIGIQIVKNLNEGLLERYGDVVKFHQENYNKEIILRRSDVSKLTDKAARARHAISTLQADNDGQVSAIMAKISGKKEMISASEAEKDLKVEEHSNKAATLKAQIAAKKKQISNLEQRLSDVKMEVDRVSKNTELLVKERTRFLASTSNKETVLASVLYTNTIQQNIAYLNTLGGTITGINQQVFQENMGIEDLENQIKDIWIQKDNVEKQTQYGIRKLQAEIEDLEAQKEILIKQMQYKIETLQSEIQQLESERALIFEQIKGIEFQKNSIQNIQIFKPPDPGELPVKPKTLRNVLQAGVMGLLLTIFLSFFVEYVSKYRKREADASAS